MVIGTATAVSAMSFAVSVIVVRSRFKGRRALDLLAFLPHSIPGIVLGLAFLWLFLNVDRLTGWSTFGSVLSLVIGFSVMFIAYGTRAMNAAILQIHRDLDEAALAERRYALAHDLSHFPAAADADASWGFGSMSCS